MTASNGDVYEGQFQQGEMSGEAAEVTVRRQNSRL